MTTRLFVGNIAYEIDEQQLLEAIKDAGVEASNPRILRDRETGRARGFGFVDVEDSALAVRLLAGLQVGGRALRVELAAKQEPSRPAARPSGGGGGGGGGDRRKNGKPRRSGPSRGRTRRRDDDDRDDFDRTWRS